MLKQISLKAARINAGLSQETLAQVLGVNVRTVAKWENAEHPKSVYVYAWAGALRIDPDIIRT